MLSFLEPQLPIKSEHLCFAPMQPQHVPGIMAIESVSFGQHHWSADSFLAEMQNSMGRYWVLLQPQAVTALPEAAEQMTTALLGYGGCWEVSGEGHITTVASHPQCRGASLGELMLLQQLGWLLQQQVHLLTLEVRVSNLAAQNLYYKYGFETQGVRPHYYQDNREDALILSILDVQQPEAKYRIEQQKAALLKRLGAWPQGFQQYPSLKASQSVASSATSGA